MSDRGGGPAGRDPPGMVGLLRRMRPGRAELTELLGLALPVVSVQVGMMLMGVVDSVMVGRVSPADLAAVALGNLYFFGVTIFGMGVLLALDPIVSQAVGAGDRAGIARSLQRGALLAVALALVATTLFLPVSGVLAFLGQPADVIPVASGYVFASIPGLLPFYLYVVLRQTLQALGRVAPIVVTIALANLANVLLNWVLIYGNLGAPELGAVGAGVSSSVCRLLMVGGVLATAWSTLRPFLAPDRAALRAAPLIGMVRLGVPIGLQLQLEYGAFAVIGVLMGWLGTVAMAGHQVAINLASLTFMVPLGVAQAAAVLVGRAVGRERADAARRAAGAGVAVGAAFMVGTAAAFLVAPRPLALLYSADPAVVALAATLIPVAGLFQVFDGVQVVATSVLRGVGDTRTPMLLHVAGFWLVGLPVSLGIGFGLDLGPMGLWWGLAVGLGVVAVLLVVRMLKMLGGELHRLTLEAPGPGASSSESPPVDTLPAAGAGP